MAAIGELHRRTARSITVDDSTLRRWVEEPLERLRAGMALGASESRSRAAIKALAADLDSALRGRHVAVSWVHGDFVPGNILVSPDGASVTGIVDWELASPGDLPLLDTIQFLVATRTLVQQRELGAVLFELLSGPSWTAEETALLAAAQEGLPGDTVNPKALLLLSWLRHVDANLSKSERYAHHSLWVARNVDVILRYVSAAHAEPVDVGAQEYIGV